MTEGLQIAALLLGAFGAGGLTVLAAVYVALKMLEGEGNDD